MGGAQPACKLLGFHLPLQSLSEGGVMVKMPLWLLPTHLPRDPRKCAEMPWVS